MGLENAKTIMIIGNLCICQVLQRFLSTSQPLIYGSERERRRERQDKSYYIHLISEETGSRRNLPKMSRMLVFVWASLNPVTSRWAREEPLSEEGKKRRLCYFSFYSSK